jgi:hypothetical protein
MAATEREREPGRLKSERIRYMRLKLLQPVRLGCGTLAAA